MDRFALSFRTAGLRALLTTALLLGAGVGYAATDAERIQTYKDFRSAFDAKNFAAAAPLAEKLVAQSEEQLGPSDKALVVPLTNLGTVNYRLANYPAAETAYQRALAIVEANSAAGADPAQIMPLHGLGEVLLATKRYEAAVVSLDRAIGLTRNLKGLYDVSQLAILPTLIECYAATQKYALAEQQHQYAFRVAETAYGRNDRRLLGPLDRYAQWYEFMGRYTTARVLHARGLQIAEQDGGQTSLTAVRPLRGLARTYWLEYIYGPEEAAETTQRSDAAGNNISSGSRLNPDGEKALQIAITTLNKQRPLDHKELGDTLIDLGDWYLIAGSANKSNDAYRLAWQQLDLAGLASQVASPKILSYRAMPNSTLRLRPDQPDEYDTRTVETRLTVGVDGKVLDAISVKSDAPEATVKAVLGALRRARYRPRIDATGAVETKDLPYTESIYVRKPVATAPADKKS
jgi:tetratricopeptide (TPR) repeat protein